MKSGDRVRVLDYGAGSGVLGLTSLLYGAHEAVGVDIDEVSPIRYLIMRPIRYLIIH